MPAQSFISKALLKIARKDGKDGGSEAMFVALN